MSTEPLEPFSVFDGVQDGITILDPVRDADGEITDFRIVYANDAALDVGGRPVHDFVGRRVADVYPEVPGVDLWPSLIEVYETGKPFRGRDLEYDATIDGTIATGWYRVLATRYGEHLIISHRDTTEARALDLAWARQEAEARLIREAFLPGTLPWTHDLEVCAGFSPASNAPIGGDWYDVFPVDGGICLVIGDVAGHGLHSAALMAQLRNAVRAYAVEDPSPAQVLTRVNRMLCQLEPGETATAIVAVWNPETRIIVRSRAGHPPILRCRIGEFGYLDTPTSGAALGFQPGYVYADTFKLLRPETTLVMYTDGLVESRREGLDVSMAKLVDYVEGHAMVSPATLCDELLTWGGRRGAGRDDVCVLAVRMR